MPVTSPVRLNTHDNNQLSHTLLFEYLAPQRLYAFVYVSLTKLSILKSVDDGATWAAQDDGNAPLYEKGSWDILQSGTDLIVIGTPNAPGPNYTVTVFDTVTDTWGATGAAGPAFFDLVPPGACSVRLVKVASGDLWAFVGMSSGPSNKEAIGYAVLSGGVWSATTDFVKVDGEFNFLQQVIVDSADLIHVIYKKNVAGGLNGSLYHKSITVGGVQGAEEIIDLPFSPYACGRGVAWVNPITLIESIVFPYYDSSNNLAGVWMGAPAAAPVWTFTLVDTLGWPAGYADVGSGVYSAVDGSAYCFVNGTDLYLGWATHDPTYNVVNSMYLALNDGSGWAAPMLIYDQIANPQGWVLISSAQMFSTSIRVLNDGTVAVVANIDCVGVAFLPPAGIAPPTDLSIECANPPMGRVGIAYSHAFPAAGGTAPYTFSIPAGSLPPGCTLAEDTGIVSGIPTEPGVYEFAVRVTDADAQFAQVGCSILIKRCLLVEFS